MNPDPNKLRHQAQEQQASRLHQTQQQLIGSEFASAEELIRHDIENTLVPPQIGERLNVSISQEPKPVLPWWKRLFSMES